MDDEEMQSYIQYWVAWCGTCKNPSFYATVPWSDDEKDVTEGQCLYPNINEFYSDLPNTIKRNYDEVIKQKYYSVTAFSIFARKTLESICNDKNAQGSNLKEKVDYLASINVIPKTLHDMANAIRYIGNDNAHSDAIKLDKLGIDIGEKGTEKGTLLVNYILTNLRKFSSIKPFQEHLAWKSPGGLYHVMTRGIERRKIFNDDEDRKEFLRRFEENLTVNGARCYAWALMPNHIHLVVRIGVKPLGNEGRT